MKYWIVIATLIYAALAPATTLQGWLDALDEDPDFVAQIVVMEPAPNPEMPSTFIASIRYIEVTDGGLTWRFNMKSLGSKTYDVNAEEYTTGDWAWIGGPPPALYNDPAPLFPSRTESTITRGQAEAFCNAAWRAAAPAGAGFTNAADIREFTVVPVDDNTVQVSGKFNVTGDAVPWQYRSYYVRLVDVNGSVLLGNANIKFERVE